MPSVKNDRKKSFVGWWNAIYRKDKLICYEKKKKNIDLYMYIFDEEDVLVTDGIFVEKKYYSRRNRGE